MNPGDDALVFPAMKIPKHRIKCQEAISLLAWLAAMCARKPALAAHGGDDAVTEVELLDDRDVPWLPIDRGHKDAPLVDGLIKTGHVEHSRMPVPMVLKLSTGTLKCQEAIRLTRKGREAVAEYNRVRSADDLGAAAEVVLRMFVFTEAEQAAMRADVAAYEAQAASRLDVPVAAAVERST